MDSQSLADAAPSPADVLRDRMYADPQFIADVEQGYEEDLFGEGVPLADYQIADSYDALDASLAREVLADQVAQPQPLAVSRWTARRMCFQILAAQIADDPKLRQLSRRERRKLLFGRDRTYDLNAMARELLASTHTPSLGRRG